jgi:hypothetical protein
MIKSKVLHSILIMLLLLFTTVCCIAQSSGEDGFGNNASKGHHLAMKDKTRIYYEVYGSGEPLVLVHGGLYGDICYLANYRK